VKVKAKCEAKARQSGAVVDAGCLAKADAKRESVRVVRCMAFSLEVPVALTSPVSHGRGAPRSELLHTPRRAEKPQHNRWVGFEVRGRRGALGA